MPGFGQRHSDHSRRISKLLWLFLAAVAIQTPQLSAQPLECKDVLHTEWPITDTSWREKVAGAREFLWRHWSDKKCAELFVTAWSREGVRTDSHYSIEAVDSNTMTLRVRLSRKDDPSAPVDALAAPPSGRIARAAAETHSYQAYTIERIEVKVPFIVETAKTIPDDKVLLPSKYRLRFRDKDGTVITDF